MRHALLVCALLGLPAPAGATIDPHLFVVTSGAVGGSTDALEIVSPWTATQNVEPVGRDAVVRHFYGLHYVVNRSDGTIQVIDPGTFDTIRTLSVGATSRPHDILTVAPDRAYVSRYDSALLLEIDPATGSLRDTIDLSPLADATNQLVDADPAMPGMQGVTLNGLIPSFRMHVDQVNRRLLVSTPGPRLDVSGGIEEIDLDTLQSLGFVFSEARAGVDLGGFVMVGPDRGYVIAHTDIVASSHLTVFDRDPNAPGQGEIYTSLYVHNDQLAYDAATFKLFYPDASAAPPGIHVFDTKTNARLTRDPVATGRPPVDLVVARPGTPGEATGLWVTGFDAVSGKISLTYQQACGATNHNIVFGPLQDVGDYGYTGQVCGIGASGSFSTFNPGSGSFFFIVVGTDGGGREGSYGLASGDIERPEDLLDPVCGFSQDLTSRCDP